MKKSSTGEVRLFTALPLLLGAAACSDARSSHADAPVGATDFARSSAVEKPTPAVVPAVAGRARTPSRPAKLEGMAYTEARRTILGLGWTPHPGECSGGGTYPAICEAFPEIGNCSGVERGFCDMSFDKPRRCLSLVTIGGPPAPGGGGDTIVDRVRFERRACD